MTILTSLLAGSPTALANSSLMEQLSAIDKAISHGNARQAPAPSRTPPPSRVSDQHTTMEAGFCAPGMECYASAARSQDPMLLKVARHLQDRQVPVSHAKGAELAPIGALFNRTLNAHSTAFLVGECHILTAAHSVVGTKSTRYIAYDPEPNKPKVALKNVKMEFYVGQTSTTPFAEKATATVEVMGKFNPFSQSDDEDWALLRLSECLGTKEKYGHFELYDAKLEQVQGKEGFFSLAGFPGDRPMESGVWLDPKCAVHGAALDGSLSHTWAMDCNAVGGMSGAPLMRRSNDGKIYVFGLTTTEAVTTERVMDSFSLTTANHVVATKSFYSAVQPFVRSARVAARQ